jgi:hypothetical protein
MPNIDLSILNQRQTPAFYADTLANRPAAGFLGRIFVSTNTFAFYRDNGTSWDLIGGPGTGTITGSGTAGTIPLWSGASTIGNSDLRQLSSEALILNSATNDWPTSIAEDPGRFLITSDTNNPAIVLWSKNPFGSGNEQGSIFLGATTGLGATTLGGAALDGFIENGTDASGSLQIRTTNSAGTETLALKIDSTQKSTFYNDIILSSGATTKRLILDADVNVARIFSIRTNNLPRWAYRVDGTESGSNTGSDFAIRRYDDTGAFVDAPLSINRATGQSTFAKKVVIENNTGDQQLQLVSSTAPSLRIDNTQTGATKRIGIGLATAVNNFIQGAADRDMCIFNGSTTISPILFGIYQTTNVQEVARFSVAGNFLVGKTTDAGYKLDVSGSSRISGNLLVEAPSQDNILSVIGQSGFEGALFISSAGSGKDANIVFGNGRNLEFHTSSSTTPVVSGTQLMTLTASGNLGIGSGSPTEKLVVTGNIYTNGTNSNIYIDNGGVGGASLKIGVTGTTETYIYSLEANDPLLFGTNNTERLRISSTGNLLIGTTTDNGQKLQVNGTALATKFQGAVNTISNATTPFGSEVSGANLYFQGSLSNGQQFGSIGGTYIFGLYFIFYIDNTTGLRGSAIYMAGDPVANGGFNLVTQSGALTFSNVYNLAASISLANNASNRGPILTNNTTNTLTFYSYVFGGV